VLVDLSLKCADPYIAKSLKSLLTFITILFLDLELYVRIIHKLL